MALEWNGFNTLTSKLEEMSKKASKEATDNALNKGADVILEAQNQSVPVDTSYLKSSLGKFDFKGTGAERKVDIGIASNSDRVVTYGYYQEYGTSSMVGKKWMKKAWEKSVKKASDAIKQSLKDDLF